MIEIRALLQTSGGICGMPWVLALCLALPTILKLIGKQKGHISQAIRCMLAEHSLPPEAWCELVGALELGLNTAVSDSTGKPPTLVA